MLIGFALIIDFIQAMMMFAFAAMQFITPIGGGISGAFAAGWYCWSTSTGILSGISSAASCFVAGGVVGAGVSAFAIPIGMAVDVTISITLGGALVIALAYMGMFYPGTVLSVFIGESIPLLDILPGWTLMTWRCLHKKSLEEKDKRKGFGGSMLGVSLVNIPGREENSFEKAQWATQQIIASRQQQQIDGIRHA